MNEEYELHFSVFMLKTTLDTPKQAIKDANHSFKTLDECKTFQETFEKYIKNQIRKQKPEDTIISEEEKTRFHNCFFIWDIKGIIKR